MTDVSTIAPEISVEVRTMARLCRGLHPALAKILIMRARHPQIGAINDDEATLLIQALGLEEA